MKVTAHHTWINAITQRQHRQEKRHRAQLLKYEKEKKNEQKLASKYMGKASSAEVKHMKTQGAMVSTKAQGTACSWDSQHQA